MKTKRTGRDAVLKMRDDMLKLVACYNAVGAYDDAASAQKMAQALHAFEDRHIITNMAWPPHVVKDADGPMIAPADPAHGLDGLTGP